MEAVRLPQSGGEQTQGPARPRSGGCENVRQILMENGPESRRQAPGAPGPWIVMTMRRFFAMFVGLSFGATGCVSPKPLAAMMFGSTPCEIRKVTTVPARRDDKVRLSLIPIACSCGPTGALSV